MGEVCPDCGEKKDRLGQHWAMSDCAIPPISIEHQRLIIGLTLGDASLQKTSTQRNAHMQVVMTNREFLEWLRDEFGVLGLDVKVNRTAEEQAEHSRRSGNNSNADPDDYNTTYRFRTRLHPTIDRLRRRFYGTGKKRFPDALELHQDILRMWYVCDGGLARPKDSRPVLQIAVANEMHRTDFLVGLFEDIGITPMAFSDHQLQFSVEDTRKLLNWMGDAPVGFGYKWDAPGVVRDY